MHLILAGPRGFCAGVNMAVESLRLAIARFGAPVYVYHEIVHNLHVVADFRKQGAIFVDDLSEVPRGAHLVFSAHGVSPQVRQLARDRQLQTIDATCPLVTRVHREAVRFAEQNYAVILIGHKGHDEVVGIMGEVPDAIRLVETVDDIDRLSLGSDSDKIVYLTQTTLSVSDAAEIIARLRARFPQIVGLPQGSICYATKHRQDAVAALTAEADVVLVLGSQNSSNSRRLREIAGEQGVNAYLIDRWEDIDPAWFAPNATVVITAGASAPESVVQGCVELLQERFGATVETQSFYEEQVTFPLPSELQS